MRLKHIYINKEGEPMANPKMPLPLHFKEEFNYTQDDIEDYADGMKQYRSGLLPFENSKRARIIVAERLLLGAIIGKNDLHPEDDIIQPDTLIPVDLNIEIVTDKDGLRLIRII